MAFLAFLLGLTIGFMVGIFLCIAAEAKVQIKKEKKEIKNDTKL